MPGHVGCIPPTGAIAPQIGLKERVSWRKSEVKRHWCAAAPCNVPALAAHIVTLIVNVLGDFAIRRPHRSQSSVKEGPRINDKIRSATVQLIDADGDNRGETDTREAIDLAQSAGLDLVEISPNAVPPVCKIMDYGRFKYQQQKKAAEAKKKQKTVEVKEIKMRPNIDVHDYDVKMRNARRFFNTGDKVKFTLRFRGREMAHQNLGMDVLNRIRDETVGYAKIEAYPKMEGRQMMMVLAPLPNMVGKIVVKGEIEPENDGPDHDDLDQDDLDHDELDKASSDAGPEDPAEASPDDSPGKDAEVQA